MRIEISLRQVGPRKLSFLSGVNVNSMLMMSLSRLCLRAYHGTNGLNLDAKETFKGKSKDDRQHEEEDDPVNGKTKD